MSQAPGTTELLEREAELAALDRVLDAAISGAGGVLVVEGAAGVGKSALLRELGERGRAAGARVLTGIGGEPERDFPFGVVRQLLEARERLREGHDLATRTGALALQSRALEELVIAGARPRRAALSGAESLTPSERRVAEHAARGLTNREIAETLFVTRKTVEFQLGAAYGKLGIRSRAQLPAALEPAA